MNDEQRPDKKIIVDEDWKSQVEAEREKFGEKPESAGAENQGEAQAEAQGASQKESKERVPLPPPSLSLLITTLATQAMVALGVVPSPISGKPELDLEQAKHFIDTIALLQDKTQGNRTDEESTMIDSVLHELRMAYLGVQNQQGSSA